MGRKTMRAKVPRRQVMVDMGHGPSESWQYATVVDSQMTDQLFSSEKVEQLLVELPGGERTWVDYWKET